MTAEDLADLVEEHGKQIYSFCCNLAHNREDADDLYQDTILKAVELRHRLDGGANPKNFLIGISVKLWQNHKKKYAVREKIAKIEDMEETELQNIPDCRRQPEQEVLRQEAVQKVRESICLLPEKIRIVIILFYTAELSVEEIGKLLHIPRGTVKSRLYQGRNMLKKYLEVWYYG